MVRLDESRLGRFRATKDEERAVVKALMSKITPQVTCLCCGGGFNQTGIIQSFEGCLENNGLGPYLLLANPSARRFFEEVLGAEKVLDMFDEERSREDAVLMYLHPQIRNIIVLLTTELNPNEMLTLAPRGIEKHIAEDGTIPLSVLSDYQAGLIKAQRADCAFLQADGSPWKV